MEKDKIVQTAQAKKDKLEKLCRALQTERTELLTELKQLRGSNDAEKQWQRLPLMIKKCGSLDQSEEIHTTLSDGVGMSHDSVAASHDPHRQLTCSGGRTDVTIIRCHSQSE